MAIQVACPGCARELRVSDDQAGKRAKCPFCQMTFQIPNVPGQSATPVEGGKPAPPPPGPSGPSSSTPGTPGQPQWGGTAPGTAGPGATPNPYSSPPTSSAYRPTQQQQDVPGIIGVVLGGVALLFDLFGCCCGLLTFLSVLLAIGGLITSFFAQKPLKLVGIILNSVALALAVIWVIVTIILVATDLSTQM